jgi:metal transporter CNNM
MDKVFLVVEVLVLIGLSASCSGLNLALMALNLKDLERKAKIGNNMAAKVLPLRRNSHLSLASILISNVAVISATSLVLDEHMSGLAAGVTSTLLIVVFGEIFPQAFFASNALRMVSLLTPFLRLIIILTYPLAKPLQLILDRFFAHKEGDLHTRSELGLLITEHLGHDNSELDEDEVEIIRGALLLSEKRVRDIMTPIRQVFWLKHTDTIDAGMLDRIKEEGWSRIPVLNKQRTECYGVILAKDLLDIDFDNNPQKVSDIRLRRTRVIGSMTALDTMFRKFIAIRSHLVPIEKDGRIVGIVTIEDLLEEILGHEIEDETD